MEARTIGVVALAASFYLLWQHRSRVRLVLAVGAAIVAVPALLVASRDIEVRPLEKQTESACYRIGSELDRIIWELSFDAITLEWRVPTRFSRNRAAYAALTDLLGKVGDLCTPTPLTCHALLVRGDPTRNERPLLPVIEAYRWNEPCPPLEGQLPRLW